MDFYERVLILAKKKYRSLQAFLISLDINRETYYSQKAAGNLPRADEALMIAQALGVTVEYLVIGINPEPMADNEVISGFLDELQDFIGKHRNSAGRKGRKRS
jgi:hypothetical protein